MIKTILALFALAITGLMLYTATRPDTFRVVRSVSIEAPAERIYPLINNLQRFCDWSPYETKDPNMQREFSDRVEGVGARYAWNGNNQVGIGRLGITANQAPREVIMSLDFEKPMKAHNTVRFSLQERNGLTEVAWAMEGPQTFLSKLMHVLFDMDKMVGKDFEAGLLSLKRLVEQSALSDGQTG